MSTATKNEEEIKYSEEEKVLGTTGTEGTTGTAGTAGTAGATGTNTAASTLPLSEEYKTMARNNADKNLLALKDLAKKERENTYAALDRIYKETEETANASRRQGLADADSAYKLSELKYGAAEEALSGSGLSGSGLSEYQRASAYQKNRDERQATYANYDAIMRQAAAERDVGKLDADIKYANAETAAQVDYNKAMTEIGEKGITYSELERQEADVTYREFISEINTGSRTLADIRADAGWSKLTEEQKAAIEKVQTVKNLKGEIEDGSKTWDDIASMKEYSELSISQQNEVKVYYHTRRLNVTTDSAAGSAYADYLALAQAGMDLASIEAIAREKGHLGALQSGTLEDGRSFWDNIKAQADGLPSSADTVVDAYFQEWLGKIQTGEMQLSEVKALKNYDKLIDKNSEQANELRDAYVTRGLQAVRVFESENDVFSKQVLESWLKSNGYTGEDMDVVIQGWQEKNAAELKVMSDLTKRNVNTALNLGWITDEMAASLYKQVDENEATKDQLDFEAMDMFRADDMSAEQYIALRGGVGAYQTLGGWTVTGLGYGLKGDTFEITLNGNKELGSVKFTSLGKAGLGEMKSINGFLEKNNITVDPEKATAGEDIDINIFADHDATSSDPGKENKIIVVKGKMYMMTRNGWIGIQASSGEENTKQFIAEFLWGSDKLKEEGLKDTGLTREEYANPTQTITNLKTALGGESLTFGDYIASADKINLMDAKGLIPADSKKELIGALLGGLDRFVKTEDGKYTGSIDGAYEDLGSWIKAKDSIDVLDKLIKGEGGYSEDKYNALKSALYDSEKEVVQNEITNIGNIKGTNALKLYNDKKSELSEYLDELTPEYKKDITAALHAKAGEIAVAEAAALSKQTNLANFKKVLERLKGLAKDDAEALGINSKDKDGKEIEGSSANAVISAYIAAAKAELEGLGNGYDDLARAGEITDNLEALLNAGFVNDDAKDAIYEALQLDANMVAGFDLETSPYKKGARVTKGAVVKALDKAVLGKTGAVSAEYNGKMYYREPIESWIASSEGYNWYELEQDYSKPDNLSGKLGDDTEYESGDFEKKWGDFIAIGDKKYSVKDDLSGGTKSALNKKFGDIESGKYVKLDGRYYVKLEKGFKIGSIDVKKSDWYYAAEAGEADDTFAETVAGGIGNAVGGFFGAVGDSLANLFGSDSDIPEGATLKDATYTETKKTTHDGATHTDRFVNGMKIYSTKGTTQNNLNMLNEKYPSAKVNTVVEYEGVYYIKEKTLFGSKWKRVVLGN